MEEGKHKHSMWMSDEVWEAVKNVYRADNCTTQNQFVEKALRFYLGYLKAKDATAYLPRVLSEILDGKLGAFGDRIGKLLFKLAVNDGMLTYIAAAGADYDQPTLDKLRVQCVNDAKRTHGVINVRDAVASLREE